MRPVGMRAPLALWGDHHPRAREAVPVPPMPRLAAQWREQQAEAQRLDAEIEANLAKLGFGG